MALENKRTQKAKLQRSLLPYYYLVPAFLLMGVITFYPLIYQLIISFTNFETKDLLLGLNSPELKFIGLKNYIDIFTGSLPVENFNFFRVLEFNFWWALSNVMLHVPAGILIATILNTEGLWLKKIYRALYILPVVVPPIVVATVWRNIFDEQYGAMNQFLTVIATFLGQADPIRLRWLTEFAPPIPGFLPGAPLTLAYYSMMIANFWLGWPFMSVVATGALQSIPKDLYEAASIDGATGTQQFWNITVPLLRPAMIPAAVYGFTLSFNLFNFVFFMTGGGPARSTELLVTFAYNLVRNLRWFGVAAAFAVIIFFVALIVLLVTNRVTRATQNYSESTNMTTTAPTVNKNPIIRFLNMNTSGQASGRNLPLWRQILIQVVCLMILGSVLFPIMYILTLSFSSKTSRPSSLELIPKEISLGAYQQVLDHPTGNPVTFNELLKNSILLSFGVGAVALLVAVTAAYSFSRFNFKMREVLMVLVFIPLLMPAVGLVTPLYLLLNNFKIMDCGGGATALMPLFACDSGEKGRLIFNLRDSLLGVGIAMTASALPFAVWNLKGYLDTIPKELEEAAAIDGADANQTFWKIILPLAAPQLAVTFFLGFIGHWQEFVTSWLFLTQPKDYTLAMTLYNMTGQYASSIPWNRFAAMAVIVALPVAFVYIALQKQIVGGLTSGSVKG